MKFFFYHFFVTLTVKYKIIKHYWKLVLNKTMELFGNNYHEMIIDLKSTLQLVSTTGCPPKKIGFRISAFEWPSLSLLGILEAFLIF